MVGVELRCRLQSRCDDLYIDIVQLLQVPEQAQLHVVELGRGLAVEAIFGVELGVRFLLLVDLRGLLILALDLARFLSGTVFAFVVSLAGQGDLGFVRSASGGIRRYEKQLAALEECNRLHDSLSLLVVTWLVLEADDVYSGQFELDGELTPFDDDIEHTVPMRVSTVLAVLNLAGPRLER